ncbi:MAG: hypothetical protein QM777_02465 [Pseudorhodoferax sp.]
MSTVTQEIRLRLICFDDVSLAGMAKLELRLRQPEASCKSSCTFSAAPQTERGQTSPNPHCRESRDMDQELTYRLGKSVLDLSRGTLRKAGARVPVRSKTFKLLSYLARDMPEGSSARTNCSPRSGRLPWLPKGPCCAAFAMRVRASETSSTVSSTPCRGGATSTCRPKAFADAPEAPEQGTDDIDLDAGAAEPKVAVMPFSLRGVDGGMKPAFETIVQEIRGAIANSRVIVVQPPARRKPSPKTVAGVDYLVEGQVVAGEPHLNVVVTLSDARSGRRLLTQSFFLKAESVVAFHQNVARQVVSALVFDIETASWHGTTQGTTSLASGEGQEKAFLVRRYRQGSGFRLPVACYTGL